MYHSVGYILGQNGLWIEFIGLRLGLQAPHAGFYVRAGLPPLKYVLVRDEPALGRIYPSAADGQGLLFRRQLNQQETDPQTLAQNLVGGFLCKSEYHIGVAATACRLRLQSASVAPFISSSAFPEKERDSSQQRTLRYYQDRKMQLGIHYPVELWFDGKEAAIGVLELHDDVTDNWIPGSVHFIYEDDFPFPLGQADVFRFGNWIGKAEW